MDGCGVDDDFWEREKDDGGGMMESTTSTNYHVPYPTLARNEETGGSRMIDVFLAGRRLLNRRTETKK